MLQIGQSSWVGGGAAAVGPAATGMARLRIPPHVIEAVLNHVSGAKASVAGIYNVYQYEPEMKAALERWARHVKGLVSGRLANVEELRRTS